MTSNILKYGTFMLFFGMITRRHFDISPVWCEYYEPSEMNDFDIPEDWIENNLYITLNSGDRAYYSSTEKLDYSKRQFLVVFCELLFCGHQFEAYLYLTKGKINSVSVFLGENIVDFYSSELLSEDNVDALREISTYTGKNIEGIESCQYRIQDNILVTLESEGVFCFPVKVTN